MWRGCGNGVAAENVGDMRTVVWAMLRKDR